MDIKCKTNPYYNFYQTPTKNESPSFHGAPNYAVVAERAGVKLKTAMNGANCGVKNGVNADKFVRRPVATKSATGLLGLVKRCKDSVVNYAKNYVKNIQHTYDHKVVFAIVEKEVFGKNSIDSITHDLDKLVLYMLGCPKSLVSKIHRNISEHHATSGKKMNLRID